ncbi:MAG: xanthine dehydrogenase family protein subunit M [Candidatus Eremiobacteraeota bacterium]|nr:xanthine dehydrogenase family protein subunit M [Candidatus Eremiobacteraeota bacterium]
MIRALVKRAETLKEAFDRAIEYSGDVFFLAGGTDLICKAKDQIVPPGMWIDITGIKDLCKIEDRGNTIHIGSIVTHSDLTDNQLIKQYAPVLADAASQVGSPQIRNRGTIGGNAGNASPAADCVTALYTMDTTIHLESPDGKNTMPIEDFFTGPGKTRIRKNEMITGFSFPKKEGIKGIYLKLGQRRALAISKVALALSCLLKDGILHDVKIALGAVAPTVIHASRCEELLEGKEITAEIIEKASKLVQQEACPIDDLRSTKEYRYNMTGVLLEQALKNIVSKD